MNFRTYLYFLVLLLLCMPSCKKDIHELGTPGYQTGGHIPSDDEKLFFDLQNTSFLLDRTPLEGRSDFSELVMTAYHQLQASNAQHNFVNDVVERIGYPSWTNVLVETSELSDVRHLIQIPFIKYGEARTQAYLIGYFDESAPDEPIFFTVKLRRDLDAIRDGLAPVTASTCQELLKFRAFDFMIFDVVSGEYDELSEEACFSVQADHGPGDAGVAVRSCEDIEVVYCFNLDPDNPQYDEISGGASGWTITSTPTSNVPGGDIIVVYGPSGDGGQSQNGCNPLRVIENFFEWLWGAASGLFEPPARCPGWNYVPPPVANTTDPHGSIGTRDNEEEYACQVYLVTICGDEDWFQVVESIPCPECTGNITDDEWAAMECEESQLEFLEEYDISLGEWKRSGADCCEEVDFEACAMFSYLNSILDLDDNRECLIEDKDQMAEIIEFLDAHRGAGAEECEENLSKAVADAYVDLFCKEGITDLELGESPGYPNNVLTDIMKEQLLEMVKELVIDFVPGATLATLGPELFSNVQSGAWMDAMYNAIDIVLNEADVCFPAVKIASVSYGLFVKTKQLKRVYEAFKKARQLGEDFIYRLYNVFRNRLHWSVTEIREKFYWLGKSPSGSTLGAKLDGVTSSNFFERLKDEFDVGQYAFINNNHGNNTPVFKLGALPYTSYCIFMEMYPNSSSGFPWTIGFYSGPCNATSSEGLISKFKIRFDN